MPVSVPYPMDSGHKETQWKQTKSSNSPSNPVDRSRNWQTGNSRTRCLLWYANSSDSQMSARLKSVSGRVRGEGCAHFLPWMHCICRQSSGQAMPRAHCSLTVDARQAASKPLPPRHPPTPWRTVAAAACHFGICLAMVWCWCRCWCWPRPGQAAHMLINNFDWIPIADEMFEAAAATAAGHAFILTFAPLRPPPFPLSLSLSLYTAHCWCLFTLHVHLAIAFAAHWISLSLVRWRHTRRILAGAVALMQHLQRHSVPHPLPQPLLP